MKRQIVGSMSEWSGALKDFFRQIDDGSIVLYNLRMFLEHRDPFATLPDINWAETYNALGMEAEHSEAQKTLEIPSDDYPNLWVVSMVKGATSNKIVAGHRKLGVQFSLCAEDLDNASIHDRDPNRDGSYIVAFRRAIEADEENKNLSADMLRERNHTDITLPERLLLGAGFYVTTGQHLDVKNITLCPGSRRRGGGVPSVRWDSDDRRVYVGWCGPGYCDGRLRSRSVVSLAGEAKPSQP